MSQMDEDGYYADYCHFFSALELKFTNLKTDPIKSKIILYTILYIRIIIW